jgi:hypothetical protein
MLGCLLLLWSQVISLGSQLAKRIRNTIQQHYLKMVSKDTSSLILQPYVESILAYHTFAQVTFAFFSAGFSFTGNA